MITNSKFAVDEASLKYQARTRLAELAGEIASTRSLNRSSDKVLQATKIRLWLKALDLKSYLTREQRERIWYALIQLSGVYDFPVAPVLSNNPRPSILSGGLASDIQWGAITGNIANQGDLTALISGKVNRTGDVMTGNLSFSSAGLNLPDFIQFDITPTTYSQAVGNMGWNDTNGTIEFLLKGGVVDMPIGEKMVARVVNGTAGNVLKSNYQVVKITGAQGQRLQVNLAQANNDANSADTLGLIAENINNNQTGFIVTNGLIEEINTTGSLQGETWADGNVLYLSPTVAGRITNIKPQAPNHTVIVGFVVYAHANHGKIFVKVDNGYELDELHNVKINTGTLANGQVLKYNSSLSVWENNSDAGITGSGTTDYVPKFATSSTLNDSIIRTSGTDTVYFSTRTGGSSGDNLFIGDGGQLINGFGSFGARNTSVGQSSMVNSTLGKDNTAFGFSSLQNATDGLENTAIGSYALQGNNGASNTSVGYYSGIGFLGNYSTSIGASSLAGGATATGSYNTAIGRRTLNSSSLSGTYNIGIGDSAGKNNTSGSQNIYIGADTSSGPIVTNQTGSNNVFIGHDARPVSISESNRTFIGNTSTTSTWLGGNLLLGSTTNTSQRLQVTGNAIIRGEIRGSGVGNTGSFISEDTQAGGATIRLTSQYGLGIPALLTDGSFPVVLATNNTEALRISTAQNLLLGTTTDIGTSILTMASTTKGFLRPRMTTVQRDAIVSPATGLSIYNTSTNKVNYYNGTAWTEIQDTITNPVTGTGTSGQVSYWSGTNTQAGSNNLFWDNANGRLGIGTNAPTYSFHINNGSIQLTNGYPIRWGTLNLLNGNTQGLDISDLSFAVRFRFTNTGNLLIGSTTDSGQRLQVTGDTLLKGSGNTSATTALTVRNSDNNTMLSISNDSVNPILDVTGSTTSLIRLNQTTANRTTYFASAGTTAEFGSGSAITSFTFFNSVGQGLFKINTAPLPTTGGDVVEIPRIGNGFAPTSGTATATMLLIRPTINQTGGANGVTRGLYVNPTLTAAADWRSIEWSNNTGWGLYGAGTANNYLAGRLGIGSTSMTDNNLVIGRLITGSSQAGSVVVNGTIQSDVTGFSYLYSTYPSVVNQTFTLQNLYHYGAVFNTKGASATITNQYGYFAAESLITATNNYGFYGNIPSGTNRWNLYMNGTANNYLAGNLAIGETTTIDANVAIQVNSNSKGIRISGAGGGLGYSIVRGTETTLLANNGSAGELLSTNTLIFYTNSTERLRIFSNGNVGIGVAGVDAGQKLQVTGDTLLKGSGNTSATTALTVQNSDGSNILRIRNDGFYLIGNSSNRPLFGTVSGISTPSVSGTALQFAIDNSVTRTTTGFDFLITYGTRDYTSGTVDVHRETATFSPTSGNGVFNKFVLNPTINQTGGANGITRGLYVNPTLTAAADWRSIEWSNNTGWGLYGAGTANNYIAGRLVLGSTTFGAANLSVRNNITGGTTWSQISSDGTIQSDVTLTANNYLAGISVADSATVSNVIGYSTGGVSLGVGSSVTNYTAFRANNNTTATNNYGFYGNIASGTGRWNLYMNGTANNYLAGRLGVGTNTPSFIIGIHDINKGIDTYQSGLSANDAIKIIGNNLGATLGIQNSNATGFSGVEYLNNSGSSKVFTGFNNNNGQEFRFNNFATGGYIDFLIAANIGFRLSNNRNLLIGTTTDAGFKLDVNGTARIQGNTTIAGDNDLIFNPTTNYATLKGIIFNTASGTERAGFKINLSTGEIRIGGTNGGGYFPTFYANSIESFRINGSGDIEIQNTRNIILATTTGTKIGTATSQKLGFFGSTPVVQRQTTDPAATRVAGGGNTITDTDTFDGYTVATLVKALRDLGLLA